MEARQLAARVALVALAHRPEDSRVRRLPHRLVVVQELLEQTLPGPQAGELDADVLPRRQPVETDERLRHVHDADRLPHVEDEDLAAAPDARRVQDELDGLGHGHEQPRDFRVRHGDRAAALDLLAEQRQHAAARVEHVAEAHGEQPGGRACVHEPELQLGHALGDAHHAHGLHRLVRGDEHEHVGAVAYGGCGHGARADHVRAQRLARIALHHRDVLVGRGVEHGVRPERAHDVVHALRVGHIPDHRLDLQVREATPELALDLVQRELVALEEHQSRRPLRGHLAHDLRADRAAGAGDHDAPPSHHGPRELAVRVQGLPEQQVLRAVVVPEPWRLRPEQQLRKIRGQACRAAERPAVP